MDEKHNLYNQISQNNSKKRIHRIKRINKATAEDSIVTPKGQVSVEQNLGHRISCHQNDCGKVNNKQTSKLYVKLPITNKSIYMAGEDTNAEFDPIVAYAKNIMPPKIFKSSKSTNAKNNSAKNNAPKPEKKRNTLSGKCGRAKKKELDGISPNHGRKRKMVCDESILKHMDEAIETAVQQGNNESQSQKLYCKGLQELQSVDITTERTSSEIDSNVPAAMLGSQIPRVELANKNFEIASPPSKRRKKQSNKIRPSIKKIELQNNGTKRKPYQMEVESIEKSVYHPNESVQKEINSALNISSLSDGISKNTCSTDKHTTSSEIQIGVNNVPQQASFTQRSPIESPVTSTKIKDASIAIKHHNSVSNSISSTNSKEGKYSNKFEHSPNKQTNKLPTIKCAGLPVIKLTQGDDNSESRQIGFAPVDISLGTGSSLLNFDTTYSTCDSWASTTEDFGEFPTSFDCSWKAIYDFNADSPFRISSKDLLFNGAKLEDENSVISDTSTKSIPSIKKTVISISKLNSSKNIVVPSIAKECITNEHTRALESRKCVSERNLSHPEVVKKPPEIKQLGEVQTSLFSFKVPGLPPAKRPPGRSKSSSISSSSLSSTSSAPSWSNSEILESNPSQSRLSPSALHLSRNNIFKMESEKEDDDAISMYAESLISEKDSTEIIVSTKTSDNIQSSSFQQPRSSLMNNSVFNPSNTFAREMNSNKVVKESEQYVHSSNSQKQQAPLQNIIGASQHISKNEVAQWTSTGVYSTVKPKISWHLIPFVFRPLCYYHFTFGCNRSPCPRPHKITKYVVNKIKNLSFEHLSQAYAYAKDRHNLFCGAFYGFVEAFLKYPKHFELISLLEDIFQIVEGPKIFYVKKLVFGLQEQGLSFNDVIEDLMFSESNKNVDLIDILLNIVCNHQPALSSNWNLVKKLLKYRKQETVDFSLIENIMCYCNTSKNRDLCTKLINDVILCYKIELNGICRPIMQDFYKLLHTLSLKKETEIMQQKMEAYNIYSQFIESQNTSVAASLADAMDPSALNLKSDLHDVNSFPDFNNINNPKSSALSRQPSPCYSMNQRPTNSSPNVLTYDQNTGRPGNGGTVGSLFYNMVTNYQNGDSQASSKFPSESLLAFSPVANHNATLGPGGLFRNSPLGPIGSSPIGVENLGYNIHSKSTSPLSFNGMNDYRLQVRDPIGSPLQNSTGHLLSSTGQNSPVLLGVGDIPEEQLPDSDMKKLKDVLIKRANCEEFIIMFNKYKDTAYSRSFLLNTIALFKSNNPENSCQFFKNLTKELQVTAMHDNECKNMLRILCVNLISVLDSQNAYTSAADILAIFYNDIHALVDTHWFHTNKYRYTPLGKYIYFCKIFSKGQRYKLAFNLFTSPELKLLQGHQSWTLMHNKEFDLPFRNDILTDFILSTLVNDLKLAKIIILRLLMEKNCIYEISLFKHFNTLILKMVDQSATFLEELKSMLPYILEGWHLFLTDSVMRGLVKVLVLHTSPSDMECLYSKCCVRGIYHTITGSETCISLTTNLTCEEIYLIFTVYLNKIKHLPTVNSLTFKMELMPSENELPKVITNASGSIQHLKDRVCTVLAKSFHHTINVSLNYDESYIRIEREEMRSFLNAYRSRTYEAANIQPR